ncbi:glycoprotein-N-acetylgalactosamine 3-beta-galactosyltransferase 1-like, partial [Ruditapes philippinarum]|uniref:glycoprotein-N-acetylgalactosamine 3-beta-galactosyltransferase 1-like n=1 Tax=Ruditapes philippinarum TaxID=129788 RepID=UPI00295B8872
EIPAFSLQTMLEKHIGPIPRANTLMKKTATSNNSYIRETNANFTGLHRKIRVLCFVLTTHVSLTLKAEHVRRTWGHKCNKLLFFSSKTDDTFPAIGLDTEEGYLKLSGKTLHALTYIFQNHFNDAEWFLKADDDTFVILENLRYFLSDKDPNTPVFFGHRFKTILKQGFTSGGAGYVLSKEALSLYGKYGQDPKLCNTSYAAEDVDFGACMQSIGVRLGNSTDKYGRSRFHCFHPEAHVIGQYPSWYKPYDANGAKMGEESMSDYAVSFHYVPPQDMYLFHYLIYHLHPHGIVYNDK